MEGRGTERSAARRGCAVGMACGALAALICWLYFEPTRPGSYSRLFALAYGPPLIIFGGIAGFVFAAVRDPDRKG